MAAGVGARAATKASASTVTAEAVSTVAFKNAKAADVAASVCAAFVELKCFADTRTNQLILRGPRAAVLSAQHLAESIARAQPADAGRAPAAPAQEIRVFPIKHPESGPSVLAAVNALLQGGTAAVPVDKGAASNPAPGAVLSPAQDALIVRSDPRTLDLIGSKLLDVLQKSAGTLQDFQSYDVRYPVPNASTSPGTLNASSTIGDLAASVQGVLTQTGFPDVHVSADPSYPRILVSGSRPGVTRALVFLKDLDRRPALVDVQALVYEIDENRASDIGLQLPTGSIQTSIGEYFPPTTVGTVVSSPTPSPVFALGKITKSPLTVAAQLNLLIQSGSAVLRATPHVSTVNGRMTKIMITNRIPFVATALTSNGVVTPSVTDYTTGTTLEMVPMINIDGSISAYLHPNYTTLTGITAQQAPLTSSREVFTTFRLQSGQAAYISGLEEINDASSQQRIPGLSRIPLIGRAFRNEGRQYTRTSLFIVLTASVIDPGDLRMAPLEIDPLHPPIPKPRPIQHPYPVAPPIPEPPVPTLTPSPLPASASKSATSGR